MSEVIVGIIATWILLLWIASVMVLAGWAGALEGPIHIWWAIAAGADFVVGINVLARLILGPPPTRRAIGGKP